MKKRLIVLSMSIAMAISMSMTAFAGQWQQDTAGWWYQNDDGSYFNNGWQWIDSDGDGLAECYYFDTNGYMLANTTTPDGNQVNENGAWTELGLVRTKAVTDTTPIQSNAEAENIPTGYSESGLSNVAIDLLEHTRAENAARYGEINEEDMAQYVIVTYQNCGFMVWYHDSDLNGKPYKVYSYGNKATDLFKDAPMTGNAYNDKDTLKSSGYSASTNGGHVAVDCGKYEVDIRSDMKNANAYIKFDYR